MPDPKATSVGADFPAQVTRVQQLIADYEALPGGRLAAFVMRGQVAQALVDWESGDVVAIACSYEALRSWE